MTKIKFITNQFYIDRGYDAGDVAWLPDEKAKQLVASGDASFHYDGKAPEEGQVRQADKDVQRVKRVARKVEGK